MRRIGVLVAAVAVTLGVGWSAGQGAESPATPEPVVVQSDGITLVGGTVLGVDRHLRTLAMCIHCSLRE